MAFPISSRLRIVPILLTTVLPFFFCLFGSTQAFVPLTSRQSPPSPTIPLQATVQLDASLDDHKVRQLFAWICRAFDAREKEQAQYNNLMLAIAVIFGNLDAASVLDMRDRALQQLPNDEEALMGEPLGMYDRQQASLGAMGAAQWTGQWTTRPHALLDLHNITSVEDWEQSLPRGCRRTLKRAKQQNFTVVSRPICNNQPAPHSSLAHFRCVMEHEVRLLSHCPETFFDALSVAISRYIGTTQMTGEIREYRLNGTVIAFAHEVRKGKTIRGQWFYATDVASKNYVWFHSVYSLVERALEHKIDIVDLGPSGSDSFSELKAKYGFVSVRDWPAVADYRGAFWDYEHNRPAKNGVTM